MTTPGAAANSAWHMLALAEHAQELTQIRAEWEWLYALSIAGPRDDRA